MSTFEFSFLLPLVLLLQCVHGQPEQKIPVEQLLHLNKLVTNRINSMLSQYKHLTGSEVQLQQYERLVNASELPIDQLDEKISALSAYQEQRSQNGATSNADEDLNNDKLRLELLETMSAMADIENHQSHRQLLPFPIAPSQIPGNLTAFEDRVIALLQKVGIIDTTTLKVFNTILNSETLLKQLKKKLDDLEDNKGGCCLWDAIFGLF